MGQLLIIGMLSVFDNHFYCRAGTGLYQVFALVTILNAREAFLVLAVIGAPSFIVWLGWYFGRIRADTKRN